jgi:MSHA biogenesis protein MshP
VSTLAALTRGPAARQAGFSLVAAIFLIVVLAALGTFAVQVAMARYQGANTQLLEARAQAAAEAGIGYGATLARTASTCNSSAPPLNLTGTLAGFVVTVSCSPTTQQIGTSPATYEAYALTATATHGSYGQSNYVARTVTAVTNAPP